MGTPFYRAASCPASHQPMPTAGKHVMISGVRVKELYRLSPNGPAKLASRIAESPSPAAASERRTTMADTIEKVSIIITKGSLEGVYPGLTMASGARAEGIDANLFTVGEFCELAAGGQIIFT